MAKKGQIQRKYSPEFKISVIMDMREHLSDDVLKALLAVDKDMWMEDVKDQEEYFAQFGDRLPAEIKKQLETLRDNLSK